MNIAIITGASSGLGKEFYKLLQNEPLDEVWVIARRESNLIDLCQKYGKIGHRVLSMDLTNESSIDRLNSILEQEKPNIKYLINNAGFGLFGDFLTIDKSKQASMIDINVRALTQISSIAINFMSEGSKIINISSIVAFAPVAKFSAYAASKSYVLNFSRALRNELKKKGINVTAVCPGPMKTEFFGVAGLDDSGKKLFGTLPYCDPTKTANGGIKAAKRGRAVYTPTLSYKLLRIVGKLVPHSILIKFIKV